MATSGVWLASASMMAGRRCPARCSRGYNHRDRLFGSFCLAQERKTPCFSHQKWTNVSMPLLARKSENERRKSDIQARDKNGAPPPEQGSRSEFLPTLLAQLVSRKDSLQKRGNLVIELFPLLFGKRSRNNARPRKRVKTPPASESGANRHRKTSPF